jgi:hypothetical protein
MDLMNLTDRPHAGEPRRFKLVRNEDVTGLSGLGTVLWGVQFPDGKVATRWNSRIAQTCVFDSLGDVMVVHGHNGKTVLEWVD